MRRAFIEAERSLSLQINHVTNNLNLKMTTAVGIMTSIEQNKINR